MKRWNKVLLTIAVAASMPISIYAGEITHTARIDIDGRKANIKLTPLRKQCKDINLFNAKWLKNKQPFYLSGLVYFRKDVWQHVKMAFTPDNSGEIILKFLGNYHSNRDKEKWFKYKNIKIDGKPLIMNDKEWKFDDGAKFITEKNADGKAVQCVKGKCHNVAAYKLSVDKDKVVTIEFDVKLAEKDDLI